MAGHNFSLEPTAASPSVCGGGGWLAALRLRRTARLSAGSTIIALVVLLLTLLRRAPREPLYRGRNLTLWIQPLVGMPSGAYPTRDPDREQR
jgi:hypothetical protein